jgi:hypothetical protein
VKFNTVIAELENTISDCLEKIVDKDELICFNKFKISELSSKLNRGSLIDAKSIEHKNQIEKLNQEIASLRSQLAVSL